VLRAYALHKSQLVSLATLVELGDWQLGQEADLTCRSNLFRAREFIAFAALAERRLFCGHFDYCNFDTYAFVVQHYEAGKTGSFSFSTRRRDSVTRHMWNAEEFAFLKPSHVDSHAMMKFDAAFLKAILQSDATESLPYESIVEFNRANTDSRDIPTHTEVVLTKSAFEYLFGIGERANEFVGMLLKASASVRQTICRGARSISAGRMRVRRRCGRWKLGHASSAMCAAVPLMVRNAVVHSSFGRRMLTWLLRLSCSPYW
jgi:hypothetical protein